jgi:hypothetical protein
MNFSNPSPAREGRGLWASQDLRPPAVPEQNLVKAERAATRQRFGLRYVEDGVRGPVAWLNAAKDLSGRQFGDCGSFWDIRVDRQGAASDRAAVPDRRSLRQDRDRRAVDLDGGAGQAPWGIAAGHDAP